MERLTLVPAPPGCSHGLVGQSPQIREIRRRIEHLGANDATVLIIGETGTGKDVVAQAIYNVRRRGQFVPIDCGTLTGPLMESELFGHVRGAFTGASIDKKGLLAEAGGGTAFFDEIGDLPLELQVKLLRFLQERQFRPVGSVKWQKAEVRVIAATNRDLPQLVKEARFREDLYHRLNVVKLSLPPLRDRKEDIALLIEHFLAQRPHIRLSEELEREMLAFDWPGNVRQLQNCIERMAAITTDQVLRLEHVPTYLQNASAARVDGFVPAGGFDGIVTLRELERRAILHAMTMLDGDKDEVARQLGIGRTTLYRKLKEYGID